MIWKIISKKFLINKNYNYKLVKRKNMATYTRQELIAAYCAKTGVDPANILEEVARVQSELDDRIAQVTERKNRIQTELDNRNAQLTERINQIQTRLDNIETDAKRYMKKIAIDYINEQNEQQDIIDNEGTSL